MFGRAGPHVFFEKDHQFVSVGVVSIRHFMNILTRIDETLDSKAQKLSRYDANVSKGSIGEDSEFVYSRRSYINTKS
jgi:hypothetical protein